MKDTINQNGRPAPFIDAVMRPALNREFVRKVALISEHASPLADPGSVDSGGQNVYVAHVARQLARQGYAVDVFTRRDDESLPDTLRWEDGVRIVHVPAGPPRFVPKEELLPFIQDFTDFMIEFCQRQERPYDINHANFWMSGLVAADIKLALSIPFVITFHALGRVRRLHQGKQDGFPDARFAIEDRVVREADHIIAECPQDEQDLLNLYGADPEKITIVPCGFDPSEIWPMDKAISRRLLGIPEAERVILQLGRMVPRKGVDNVVRGFARLVHEHGLPARLLIVGGGSDEPDPLVTPEIGRLQAIAAEEGVSDQITFTGRRGRKALKHYFSAADVFISTPWYEPFGITPVEAMACGTPVIGSKVGGIQYTVRDGETGYLVPPNDPQALAERLAHLYRNPSLLKRLSLQALQRANDLFTWQKVSDSIAGVYEEVFVDARKADSDLLARGQAGSPLEVIDRGFKAALYTMQQSRQILPQAIQEAAGAIVNCLAQGNKILVCGNGGSAADAQHFAAELVGRFVYPGRKGLPVLALNADTAFLTAWSNDIGYDQIFSRQVQTFGKPGDLLIGISTSGRSPNLVEAFNTARSQGINCLAMVGGDGGELKLLADISLVVPSANSQRIQEVQILILHLLCELVEPHFLTEQFSADPSLLASISSETEPAWDL